MKAWGVTNRGMVRSQNQDAYYHLVEGKRALLLVCDGMGGARAGNIASRLAAETFVDTMRESKGQPARQRLTDALAAANQKVYRTALEDKECFGMGTTLVAALVEGRTAQLLNVGDSRAYYIDEDGIRQITRDHSVVEDMVARGDITPEEARTHPRKNLITRALGSEERIRADLYEKELQPGDFLLLCSDGLSNIVTDQELLYEAIHGGEPSDCCQRLLHITLSRGAPDNVTAVLFQIV